MGVLSLRNAIRVCIIRNGILPLITPSPHFVSLVPVRATLLLFSWIPIIGLYQGPQSWFSRPQGFVCVAQVHLQAINQKDDEMDTG